MFQRQLHLVVLAGSCLAVLLLSAGAPLRADAPQTQSVTFALLISVDGSETALSDFLSDDTAAVVIGATTEATGTFSFAIDSPPCDGLDLSGSDWTIYAHSMILNRGKPIRALVLVRRALPIPPTRSVVLPNDVNDVWGCWLKPNGSGEALVQDSPDPKTSHAFFLLDAEFRVVD